MSVTTPEIAEVIGLNVKGAASSFKVIVSGFAEIGSVIVMAIESGSSMFVIHRGKVSVQVNDNGRPRTVATLAEGAAGIRRALRAHPPQCA